MVSSSMEPTISGRGNSPSKQGDVVFYSTLVAKRAIAPGDLVLIGFTDTNNNRTIRTVRRVAEVCHSSNVTARMTDPAKSPLQFRVTADSTNGLDSDSFGLLP